MISITKKLLSVTNRKWDATKKYFYNIKGLDVWNTKKNIIELSKQLNELLKNEKGSSR